MVLGKVLFVSIVYLSLSVKVTDGRIVSWSSPPINKTNGNGIFEKTVVENSVGNLGIRVQANTDISPFPYPMYSIVSKPAHLGFSVDRELGDIKLTSGILDFETNSYVVIVVVADDGDVKATATCTINMLDRNDNVPMFPSIHTSVTVINGLKGGSFVTSVRAFDKDGTAPYNTITYTIHGNHRSDLQIHDQGDITVTADRVLDKSKVQVYALMVMAKDGASYPDKDDFKNLDRTRYSANTTVEICVGACPPQHPLPPMKTTPSSAISSSCRPQQLTTANMLLGAVFLMTILF